VLTLADPAYPPLLLEIADPPLLLYVRGRAELLSRPGVAIIGSRNASAQGMQNAAAFAQALGAAGLTIISGLALGIDAHAHEGGLRTGASTVAVIGTGADLVYPRRNLDLAQRIAEQGCIVSEYALGLPAMPGNFPRRNRLISGLARGVLVIEAAAQSGSLITARLAGEQGRDVYALPGSIHATLAKVAMHSSSRAPSWSSRPMTCCRSCSGQAACPARRCHSRRGIRRCWPRWATIPSMPIPWPRAAAWPWEN